MTSTPAAPETSPPQAGQAGRPACPACGDELVLQFLGENPISRCRGCDGVWLSARRIDGQFPDYTALKPESFEAEMRASKEELADVTRRVAVLAQRNTALRLSLSEGQLQLRAQTQDVGEAEETLPVSFSGQPVEIGFNPGFFLEGLESVEADEIVLRLINPLRPGLISGESDDFWYLIMPIRLAS